MTRSALFSVTALSLTLLLSACGGDKPPVANMPPPPPPGAFPSAGANGDTAATPRPPDPPPVPVDPSVGSSPLLPLNDESLEVINGPNSPLAPAFFAFDSDTLDEAAKRALEKDAALLSQYTTWVITIEGHCDERGSAEYNLALGERRAAAARNYLVSLGIAPDRLRTVSYGKEFPFDQGHDEAAWQNNRRAHLMLTAK